MYLLGILLYGCFATCVFSCFVERDYKKPMSYLLNESDIVVYGEDLQHFEVNTSMELVPTATNSLFRVYCILKSDGKEMNENITIETIKPRSSCSNTWHEVGDKVIASLRRTDSGHFEWHEVNNLQSAAYEGSEGNFDKASSVLTSEKWKPPSDAEVNMCPMEYVTMEGAPKPEDARSDHTGSNKNDTEFESAQKFEDNMSDTETTGNLKNITSGSKETDTDSSSNSENNSSGQKATNSLSERNFAHQMFPNVTVLIAVFIFIYIIRM